MKKYTVSQTIQSRDLSNPPVTVQHYSGTDLGQALHALVGAAVDRDDESSTLPMAVRYTVLSAVITHEEV